RLYRAGLAPAAAVLGGGARPAYRHAERPPGKCGDRRRAHSALAERALKGRRDMIRTPVCDVLGIEHPIALGGMGSLYSPPLVAAVSNAGGLGAMGCHYM